MGTSIRSGEIIGGGRPAHTVSLRSESGARTGRATSTGWRFHALDAAELRLVRQVAGHSRRQPLRALSVVVSRLGDGWVYIAVAALVAVLRGWQSVHFLLAGLTSVVVCYTLYWGIKPRLARMRPCERDFNLASARRALDKYSFPSGHCMSAAAVGVALYATFPDAAPLIVAAWLLLAWSRMALAHHYLTDIIGGGLIGCAVSLAVASVGCSAY